MKIFRFQEKSVPAVYCYKWASVCVHVLKRIKKGYEVTLIKRQSDYTNTQQYSLEQEK